MSEEGKTSPPPPPPVPAAAPAAPAAPVLATIDDFKKLAFKVGKITAAADHPNADKLLVLTVDIGEAQPRQIVAGIKSSYQAADLIGKHVVVVANLKPATLRGVESQGMVLAASDASSIILVSPERPIGPGNPVK
jgi:methionyl-tRNA synthetase